MAYLTLNRPKLQANFDFLETLFGGHDIDWGITTKLLCGNKLFLNEVIRLGRLELLDWAEFVLGGATEDEFVAYCRTEITDAGEDLDTWSLAMPFWQSYQGLRRWADKHSDLSPAS